MVVVIHIIPNGWKWIITSIISMIVEVMIARKKTSLITQKI